MGKIHLHIYSSQKTHVNITERVCSLKKEKKERKEEVEETERSHQLLMDGRP